MRDGYLFCTTSSGVPDRGCAPILFLVVFRDDPVAVRAPMCHGANKGNEGDVSCYTMRINDNRVGGIDNITPANLVINSGNDLKARGLV